MSFFCGAEEKKERGNNPDRIEKITTEDLSPLLAPNLKIVNLVYESKYLNNKRCIR